jgi:hypothetical protein
VATRPNWVREECQRRAQGETATLDADSRERHFRKAAQVRWEHLLNEVRADVEDFNRSAGSAEFSQPSPFEFRVHGSPLHLVARADLGNHTIYYQYESDNTRHTAAPEGGMLSIRLSRYGRAELYSSDERLSDEESRRMLLEPVFFPTEPIGSASGKIKSLIP